MSEVIALASGVEAGVAYISIAASTKDFAKDVKSALGDFDAEAQKVIGGKKGFGARIAGGFKTAGKAGLAFGGILTGLAVKGGISRALSIEDARSKMQGLKLDTETIDRAMSDALASVKGTAFGLGDAAGIASTMIAAGIKPGQDLERTLTRIADSATVAGTDLQDMGLIWGKAAAKGRIDGQLMNQMLERQIPIYDILGEAMGKSAEDVQKLVSQGKVDFQTFSDAMDEYVGGAAQRSGETTRGAWANMLASFSRVGEQLISGIFPKVRGFFEGVMNWADKVAPYAARVGELLGEGLAKAADWIQANVLPVLQRLGDWVIDNVVPALKTLSNWITQTGIPALKDLAGWIRDNIFPYFQDIANVITEKVVPAISNFIGEMQSGEGAGGRLVDAIKAIYEALKTAVTWLVQNRTLVWSLVGAYAAYRGALVAIKFGKFIAGIGKSIAALGRKSVAFVKNTIAGAKWMAWQVKWAAWNTKNFIVAVAKWIGSVAKSTALWLKNTAAIIANRTAQIATTAATKVATTAQKLFNLAMNASPIMRVVTALTAVVGALTYFFTQTEIGRKIWQGFVDFLSAAWKGIRDLAVTVWQGIADFFTGLWDGIKSTVETVWNAIKEILSWHPLALIVDNWQGIADFFVGLWSSIIDGITSAWSTVQGFFKGLPGEIRGFFANAATWLVNAGKNIITGARDGIVSAWNAVATWFGERPAAIRGFFTDALDWLLNAGKNIINGVRNGLLEAWSAVRDWFRGRPKVIKDWFIGAGKWLIEAGKNVMQGFFDGVKSGWNLGKSIFSTITKAIPGLKGPKSVDLKMLVPAGRWIMQGFRNGIEAEWPNVKRTLSRVTDAVADTQFDLLKKGPFSGSGWGGWGEAITDELTDGLDRKRGEAVRSMRSTMTDMHRQIDGDGSLRFAANGELAATAGSGDGGDFEGLPRWQLDYLIDGLVGLARGAGLASDLVGNARRRAMAGGYV